MADIAIENGPFIVYLPTKMVISTAMLVYQRYHLMASWKKTGPKKSPDSGDVQ